MSSVPVGSDSEVARAKIKRISESRNTKTVDEYVLPSCSSNGFEVHQLVIFELTFPFLLRYLLLLKHVLFQLCSLTSGGRGFGSVVVSGTSA